VRRRIESASLPIVFAVLASVGNLSCGQDRGGGREQPKAPAGTQAIQDRAGQQELSDQDCRDYAQAVVRAVATGDQAAFNGLVDWDLIFDTATARLGVPETARAEYIRGLRSEMETKGGLGRQIIEKSRKGGEFSFLRTREKHGRRVALFRSIGPPREPSVGYYEFVVTRGPDGKIRGANIYSFSSGELMSEGIRRILLPSAASKSRTILDKLLTGEQDSVRDNPKLPSITAAINQGNMQSALEQIKQLRPGTRKQKAILLLRLRAAQSADAKDYAATAEEFRTLFPQDPCLDLLLIDYYLIKNDFARALECVDRLDRSVGGDPYLTLARASIAVKRGDRAEARRLGNAAIDQDPSFQKAYYFLVDLALEDGAHAETLSGLQRLHSKFKMQFKDLRTVPAYAGFVKSSQYLQWLHYLEEKAKEQQPNQQGKPLPGAEKGPSKTKPSSTSGA
jgi:hypothetical protein